MSCPPRLVAQAGESVLLSCTARSVPEEGVRYEWESLSGDGLHLLSASDERSPLFTAPVSGENAEYAYRLTAMGPGIYRTATVTVVVDSVPGDIVQDRGKSPGLLEECDPFTIPDELGEGCLEGKAPDPFGFGFEEEGGFLFPEAPGLPDRPSGPVRGGGSGRQAPPRLECPVAVFLEELETGTIECHAWDAAGEEYLEYSWEPAGSTTRDYLDNPRLLPEDAPNPSVVAPEAPVYETLESFHSGETTFRYRYRLTATSRATGLSSSQEVEVFVSSSRPAVYCPLEIVVEEGETVTLDCEGADPLSARMDYDEEAASVLWEWEGLWGTSTAPLAATHLSSPLFTAPLGSAGEEYHYIASMTTSASGVPRTARRRVTVTVTGAEEGPQTAADDLALMVKGSAPVVTCEDAEVYEATADFTLDCSVTDEPTGATYAWAVRGSTSDTDDLSSTIILKPTFSVPTDINESYDANKDYEYTVTLSASGITDVTEDVKVTVLEKPDIDCSNDGTFNIWFLFSTLEGNRDREIFDGCSEGWQGAPAGSNYTFAWAARGSTPNTDLLSATNIESPIFYVPDAVDEDETYEYTFTVSTESTENVDDYTYDVTVTVRNRNRPYIIVTCEDSPYDVDEGDADFDFDCEASGAPGSDPDYTWAWSPTTNLTDHNTATPTFSVPDDVDQDTTYTYTVTATAQNADDGTAEVTVTVRNTDSTDPSLTCTDSEVYEGTADFTLDCSVTNEPSGATYAWEARGSTSGTSLLSSTTILKPTFAVPDDIDELDGADKAYEYTVTLSASGITDVTENVTVTVLEKPDIGGCPATASATMWEGDVQVMIVCQNWSGAPGVNPVYTYRWTPRGGTTDTQRLSDPDQKLTRFHAPEEVDDGATEIYEYRLTVSAANADNGTVDRTIFVMDKPNITLTCADSPYEVHEGDADIELECEASGRWDATTFTPLGTWYTWQWLPRTNLTGDKDIIPGDKENNTSTPTFAVPDNVDRDTTYTYTVTATSANSEDGTAEVTVAVKDTDSTDPSLTCTDSEAYEGTADITLDCSVTDEPSGAMYAWTVRGSTSDTDDLSSTTILEPTFSVSGDIDESGGADKDYEYTVTMSATDISDITADVTVTVLEKPDIVPCGSFINGFYVFTVYEGAEDFQFPHCGYTGAPDPAVYGFGWTTKGSTPSTAISLLSAANIERPFFLVPDEVSEDEKYEYTMTVSADNADPFLMSYTVHVKNKPAIVVTCADHAYTVTEGDDDITLDCSASGGPDGSTYTWSWSPTTNLTGHDTDTPTFAVPDDVDEDTTYTYTVTATADNAEDGTATVTVTVRDTDSTDPSLTCTDSEVYEGTADFALGCSVANEPTGATYAWTSSDIYGSDLLSSAPILNPRFSVPDDIPGVHTDDYKQTYEYTVTMSAPDISEITADVTVTVLEKPNIRCGDQVQLITIFTRDEGDPDFQLNNCPDGWTRAPGANPVYTYAWTARGSTANTDLLSATNIEFPTFAVPDTVESTETYQYSLTVSAANADDMSVRVTVRVRDTDTPAPVVTCSDSEVYEATADFTLDCSVTDEPTGATYAWTARGSTSDKNDLSSTTVLAPTFHVPGSVNADTNYEYTVTLSASSINDVTEDVTVTVLDKKPLTLICTPPPSPLYEGAADFALECTASGAPSGSSYRYAWTPRGSTPNTDKLSSTTVRNPTFDVPEEVDSDETYEYTLTVSAENAEDATANVTVRVLDKKPLEVVCATPSPVHEGAPDFALDCAATGAQAGSGYVYAWTGRGSTTNTDRLISGADGPTPTFDVPETVDADETYEYLLTVSAENAIDATAEVTVKVLRLGYIALICATPPLVYEGSEDFALDCSISGDTGDADYTYAWTAGGDTQDTSLLSAVDITSPAFLVPDEIAATTTYEYLLTASAENAIDATAEVSVTVLNHSALAVACVSPPLVYEGSADFDLDCTASGAPVGSSYTYAWTARGSTANTDLLIAGTDGPTPTFSVPDAVDATTTYEYLLTVNAENAESGSAEVAVTVLNHGALAVVCADPGSVYEGSDDVAFDCSASGAPSGSSYTYAWTARGDTQDTSLLSAVDIASPTFLIPDEVASTTTYEYLLTVNAENAESGSAEVAVMVLNQDVLAVVCTDPGSVYEGSDDVAFDCSASGAPSGSSYTYAWTAGGDTQDTSLLSAVDITSPTFLIPDEVASTTTYEYLLTVNAENAESGSAEVAVTVLNHGALAVVCADPGSVYEGSDDVAFDCSASGAPSGSSYTYAWTARGDTQDTSLLSAVDIASPTFLIPDEVASTTTYEYLLTVNAENAESGSAEVAVTVLNHGALAVVCADPGSVYEGSDDVAFDCSASGAPSGSSYTYAWTARGDTQDTSLLSAVDIASPTFLIPDEVASTTTYEYLLTVNAENAESGSAEVAVTVLNHGALAVVCADPGSVYEGSDDVAFDCSASGAPSGSSYTYAWTARGDTQDTSLLSAVDIASPTFLIPDEVASTTTYEYLLTVNAENAESGSAEVAVTVLNHGALAVVCADPGSVYEGSDDVAFDCSASGAPSGSSYTYAWTARGDTQDTSLLSAVDIASPTFLIPDEVASTTTYEYLLTVNAENAESGSAEVAVTVLNHGALAVVCADPGSVYEGSDDVAFDCSASGAPSGSSYTYAWTARGDTQDTSLLSAVDIASPTFAVPAEVDEDETYEYLLRVSAENAEDATAEVTVTVFDRTPSEPVLPPAEPSPPVASSSARESSDPTALGVTVSASPLRFGVQSADTQVSLDPMTDGISTHVSGPYHGGRMTLALDGSEALDENGEMDLSIELASPVLLKRADAIEASSLVLAPAWSYVESCDQLSSQTIGGLYTEVTLSESDCRLLRFGGELDLTGVPSGRYAGSLDVILRSGESEETFAVEVTVTVVPTQRVITIGPGGVRFSTSRGLPAGLTEEQNLSIYPDFAFLTEEKPDGVFELSNPSLVPLEVSVSARFGYTEATETGREVVVEDTLDSRLGDLSQLVDIHPGVLVLMPGEKGLVRYGVKEGALAAMAEQGYAAFFDVVSEPRLYVRSDQMPQEVSGDRTARVTMRVPGVYVPGEGASQLRATLLSISFVGPRSATFLLETQDHPFVGEVVAYDGDGHELGRRETLVYTRSRVRVPLSRMPEEGAVFLRFSPRGSGRVPEPASIEWDAPRRDIGAAEDKDRATTPEVLVQKP